MNGHLTRDDFAALALGIADETEAAPWRAHLAECEDCRAALAADREMMKRMAGVTLPEAPARRWEAMVRGALEEARPRPAAQPAGVAARAPREGLRAWGLRAAVLLVVFLLGYHVGTSRKPAEGGPAGYEAWTANEKPAVYSTERQHPGENSGITSGSFMRRVLMVRAEDQPAKRTL